MTQLRQGLLPLEDLDDQQFEAFVLLFLGAGISLEVVEPPQPAAQKPSRAARYRLVSASLYGGSGPGGQRGIDIRAVTETGAEWVFQCKHYRSGFTAAKARAAVTKAEREYPSAARYFLVLSGEPVPKVRETVEKNLRWEIWGGSELSVRFFNEVERSKQIELLRRVFPQSSEALITRLYPHHDDLLVEVDQFFAPWLKKDRLFHHRAALVGREKSLQALHDFVEDKLAQAFILSAPGGVGKTRLLLAFGETFARKHPGRKLFFVDPAARPGVGSDRLRAAREGELVVVQDDAHRTESLRDDVAAALVEKNGKLVLATRPHGVDVLIAWLTRAGMDHARIQVFPPLPALPRTQLVALARECLPDAKQAFAEPLAELAKGCTLIVPVGAQLIAEDGITPAQYLNSQDFQRAVFDRFEAEGFAQVATKDREPLMRDTLRLLAVLAPWNDRLLSLDEVAALLRCTPREFQENFDRLRAAGLLAQTREGWRVVPDLFADHLVYRGCYGDKGRLTPFARRLQTELIGAATGTMLRNLAEAEWQAQLEDQHIESLLDPFWKQVCEKFAEANFWDRAKLIQEWRRFAVYQPERSLHLARLALDLAQAAPAPEEYRGTDMESSLFSHAQVLGELPALLEPIAVYHADHRSAALNLLWELYEKRGRVDENAQNDPLATIGRVAKFQVRHPVETPLAVVEWLADKLDGPQASMLCDQPSPVLAVVLKPIFEHDVEDNFSTGRTFHFRSWPLSVKNTRKVRTKALQTLSKFVIPRGEIATLNALSVISAATDVVRLRWKNIAEDELQREWLPERRAALAIVEQLITKSQSVRVLFRIVRLLRPHVCHEPQLEFRADCARVLALIPESPGLRLTRVLLSNAWDEFFYHTPDEEKKSVQESKSKVEEAWESLTMHVATEFVHEHATAPALVSTAESVAVDYQRAGMPPQFSDLFNAIARLSPDLAASCIDVLLAKESSPVDYWWTSWFVMQRKLPDERLLGWIRLVLRQNNTVRWRPLQFVLRWVGIGEVTNDVLVEIAAWARRLTDDTLEEALAHLRWRGDRDRPIDETILVNLNLERFSDKSLARLGDALGNVSSLAESPLPAGFAVKFIRELGRVERLDSHEERSFLWHLSSEEPRLFYEMLRQRVLVVSEQGQSARRFEPLPFHANYVLVELPKVERYAELAQDLFGRLRQADEKSQYWWSRLFQRAVLQVSPFGLELIRQWLAEINDAKNLELLIDTLKFEGSRIIFNEPDLVKAILKKIRTLAPAKFEKMSWNLGQTSSPQMRGYTNHKLDTQYRYYREEAAKAAAVHAYYPELAAFFREIVLLEDTDAAQQSRWAELESSEWE